MNITPDQVKMAEDILRQINSFCERSAIVGNILKSPQDLYSEESARNAAKADAVLKDVANEIDGDLDCHLTMH